MPDRVWDELVQRATENDFVAGRRGAIITITKPVQRARRRAAMGSAATELMHWLAKEYVKAGFPRPNVWSFSPRSDQQRVTFNELRALGLIEPFTTGGAHRLTEKGKDWIMANRPDEDD